MLFFIESQFTVYFGFACPVLLPISGNSLSSKILCLPKSDFHIHMLQAIGQVLTNVHVAPSLQIFRNYTTDWIDKKSVVSQLIKQPVWLWFSNNINW